MNYMRGVNGQTSFHPGTPFIGGDLANLSSDLQQSPYEFDKQVGFHKFNDDFFLTFQTFFLSNGKPNGHIKITDRNKAAPIFTKRKTFIITGYNFMQQKEKEKIFAKLCAISPSKRFF